MGVHGRIALWGFNAAGLAVLAWHLSHWTSQDPYRFGCLALLGAAAAGFQISLPGMRGTLSANFLFILYSLAEFGAAETVALGCFLTLMQCLVHAYRRPGWEQVVFNVAVQAVAIALARAGHDLTAWRVPWAEAPVRILVAAGIYFVANSVPVAAAIAASEAKRFRQVWREAYLWSFPYYLLGAGLAALASLGGRLLGWQTALILVPVVYLFYRSYALYLGRLEDEKRHAQEMASLQLRTIEALALAIEAKDSGNSEHLQRIEVYATRLGEALQLPGEEIAALRAAAYLHDIGKLAIPEHLMSKSGGLTPEEQEKLKIHPVIGAEILARVQFPYPVEPIVRCHHERWDGSGYPAGLRGEAIPLGARVLAVADQYEALTAGMDGPARTPQQALAEMEAQSGSCFDPNVITALRSALAEMGTAAPDAHAAALPAPASTPTAGKPATGFEPSPADDNRGGDFLRSIASARQEVQTLFELAQDLGNSLSLEETLSVLATRLRKIVPHHCLAIYLRREQVLYPEYVNGDEYRLFSSLEIPVGQGLSGWVAENHQPVINGNPSVEPGYLNDPDKSSHLRSALAVPLEGVQGLMGVLTLYHADRDAFSRDHLRILMAMSSKVALSIENALRYRLAESSATTDYLTGLPNARSLFQHLETELSRCERTDSGVTLLVCDLDGFKQVNDRFGHLEGNRVLRTVAKGLKEACRDYDYVARMGGDEFVLVLPGVKPEDVDAMIQRFEGIALQAGVEVCGEPLLAISVGRACYPADGRDGELLLAEADKRMYKQKQENKRRLLLQNAQWQEPWASTIQ
jgi:diguanylate cyclase (GGDEF)-like protein/putative nucleotidyltransferase with HDIG domain